MANHETVLKQLKEHVIRLNKDKCQFFEDAVEYLGHRVDAQDVHTSAKISEGNSGGTKATECAGTLLFPRTDNYSGKFLSYLATMLHPLNVLLRSGQQWRWLQECTGTYQEAKCKLMKAPVLVHFDAKF